MKKRIIDRKLTGLQVIIEKMEPLENVRLKRWRAGLVLFFSFGFLLAMVWVSYQGYEGKIYAQGRHLNNIVVLEYDNQGVKRKLIANPLVLDGEGKSIKTTMQIDLENLDKYLSDKGENLFVFQTANKKTAYSGSIITYNIYILNTSGQAFKSLVLYDLLPAGAELIWDKNLSSDEFKQIGDVLLWSIGDFTARDDNTPALLTKTFRVKVR